MSAKNNSSKIDEESVLFTTNKNERWLEYAKFINNEKDDEWLLAALKEEENKNNNDDLEQCLDESEYSNYNKNSDILSSKDEVLECDCTFAFRNKKVFHSLDELTEWCKTVGKSCGVVVIIKQSEKPKNGRRGRISYWCERSGFYEQKKKKKPIDNQVKARKTGTKKCGCPFLLKGVKLPLLDQWRLEVVCGLHNHPLEINTKFEGHSYIGRLSKNEEQEVIKMTACGVKAREVLRVLKENDPNNASTIQTIYNFKAKHRIIEMEGMTYMQQMLYMLDNKKYIEFHRRDENTEEVLDMFFAHPYSMTLIRCFPHVLIMDCTYKTNRHGKPLLEIVGVTSTWKTFIVAHAFLYRETVDNYLWALQCLNEILGPTVSTPSVIITDRELSLMNAIHVIFPCVSHLLCTFHISKNIEAKGKKYFETKKDWNDFIQEFHILIDSSTEHSFNEAWKCFKIKNEKYTELLAYIDYYWFKPFKEKFVATWTNSVRHFGNRTTNRVESQHSSLKRYLASSQGNLVQNLIIIDRLVTTQHVAIRASLCKSVSSSLHNHHITFFNNLRGFVSHHALDQIIDEMKKSEYVGLDISKCGCILRQTHGLPYAHEIVQLKQEHSVILLSSIHHFWRKLNDNVDEVVESSLDPNP